MLLNNWVTWCMIYTVLQRMNLISAHEFTTATLNIENEMKMCIACGLISFKSRYSDARRSRWTFQEQKLIFQSHDHHKMHHNETSGIINDQESVVVVTIEWFIHSQNTCIFNKKDTFDAMFVLFFIKKYLIKLDICKAYEYRPSFSLICQISDEM